MGAADRPPAVSTRQGSTAGSARACEESRADAAEQARPARAGRARRDLPQGARGVEGRTLRGLRRDADGAAVVAGAERAYHRRYADVGVRSSSFAETSSASVGATICSRGCGRALTLPPTDELRLITRTAARAGARDSAIHGAPVGSPARSAGARPTGKTIRSIAGKRRIAATCRPSRPAPITAAVPPRSRSRRSSICRMKTRPSRI